jgi:hypothetical protein
LALAAEASLDGVLSGEIHQEHNEIDILNGHQIKTSEVIRRASSNVHRTRFKESLKPMDKASEAILRLKPVIFRYKHELDPDGIRQFGLAAEQVEKVNPDLVARDAQGKVNTVRYEAVNALLLNEFLKEHRKVEEQGAIIAKQQKQIDALWPPCGKSASESG